MGRDNTQAAVTGQEELLVRIGSLNTQDTTISSILGYLAALESQERAPNVRRDTLPGNISKPYSFSIANVGTANGTVEGAILKPGEIVNFDAGALNNAFGSATYDATGTEFLITWIS